MFAWRRLPAVAAFALVAVVWLAAGGGGVAESAGPSAKDDSKISARLLDLLAERDALRTARSTAAPVPDFDPLRRDEPRAWRGESIRIDDAGYVQVYITTDRTDAAALSLLESLGARIERFDEAAGLVQAWVRPAGLEALAGAAVVRRVSIPDYGVPAEGSKETEGDVLMRSHLARGISSFSGAGVKVGVISFGVRGRALSQASGDLPDTIEIDPQFPVDDDGEGTAMLEIVHDIAPGAQLAFSGPATSLDFVAAIEFLAYRAFDGAGADIIVDDIGFLGQPYFEDGSVAKAAKRAVDDGAVYVSAAGNAAHLHYEGAYNAVARDGESYHQFAAGDISSLLTFGGAGDLVIILQWSDPWGSSGNDFDLWLCEDGLRPSKFHLDNNYCYAGRRIQDGNDNPYEDLLIPNDGFGGGRTLDLYILADGTISGTPRLELFGYRGLDAMEHVVAEGSVFGHAAVSGVIAVGAISAAEPGVDVIQYYSSQGPSEIFSPARETRMKPDVVGIDGIQVTGNGGFVTTFFGTSAAAPHVAAVAALAMEAQRQAEPNSDKNTVATEVARILKSSAVDLGVPGADNVYGHGRVDALDAIAATGQLSGVTYTVNSTGNEADFSTTDGDCATTSGGSVCTLRAAIEQVNADGGGVIEFGIAGAGPHTIAVTGSRLPYITVPIVIDGLSQSGAGPDAIKIELDGNALTGNTLPGLRLNGAGGQVRGLAVNRFPAHGVVLATAGDKIVEHNSLGVAPDGATDRGNGGNGVSIRTVSGNYVVHNLISGNSGHGIRISDSGANLIGQNRIGANAGGTAALANDMSGVSLWTTNGIRIVANLISGNTQHGIAISKGVFTDIRLNSIGSNGLGDSAIANGGDGIELASDTTDTAVVGNIIAFNTGPGVSVAGNGSLRNTIRANSIFGNTGMGIDLGDDGRTENDNGDGDSGPNTLRNFTGWSSKPVLNREHARFRGIVDSPPNFTIIDFYASETCPEHPTSLLPHKTGVGKIWLGYSWIEGRGGVKQFDVSTFIGRTPSVFSGALDLIPESGTLQITATATSYGLNTLRIENTSEFSNCEEAVRLPDLELSGTRVEIVEGAAATYTVALAAAPASDTVVKLASGLAGETTGATRVSFSPATLTFTSTDWGAKTVTLTGLADADALPDHAHIDHSVNHDSVDYGIKRLLAEVADNYVLPELEFSVATVELPEGGSANYTVALTSAPAADLRLLLVFRGDDGNLVSASGVGTPPGVDFTTTSFGAKSVTLAGGEDTELAHGSFEVIHKLRLGGHDAILHRLPGALLDNDRPMVVHETTPTSLDEGAQLSVHTTLNKRPPEDPWTVYLAGNNASALTFIGPNLLFTPANYNTAGTNTVTLAAPHDANFTDETVTLGYRAVIDGVSYFLNTFRVTVDDSGANLSFTAGGSVTASIAENSALDTSVGTYVTSPAANSYIGMSPLYWPLSVRSATGEIYRNDQGTLDFEEKALYKMVVNAVSPSATGAITVTVNVTNLEEAGTVTLDSQQPEPRTALKAELTDPDGRIVNLRWSWDRTTDPADLTNHPWTAIAGETADTYTPAESDGAYYLRATASYDDGQGAGKSAQAQTANAVPSVDATLSALTVGGKSITLPDPAQRPLNQDYFIYHAGFGPDVDSATVAATTTDAGATLVFVSADADTGTAGHQAALQVGLTVVELTVTASNGSTVLTHYVYIGRATEATFGWNAQLDFNSLDAAGNNQSQGGIYSDGATMWVTDVGENKVYSYDMTTRERYATDPEARDIDLKQKEFYFPRGMTGHGTTLWVMTSTGPGAAEISSYSLAGDGTFGDHLTSFALSRTNPWGILADDSTVWAIYPNNPGVPANADAYNYDGTRNAAQDIARLNAAPNAQAAGWRDETTLWMSDRFSNSGGGRLFAFCTSDWSRAPNKDFTTLAPRSQDPWGLWSDGTTMWVLKGEILHRQGYSKIYAYNMPANALPVFPAGSGARDVAETSTAEAAIGAPLAATDTDRCDRLTYELSGTDASSFNIDPETGQITAAPGVTLDHEDRPSYEVDVTVIDAYTASASTTVAITVSDVNEAPVFYGLATVDYDENGTAAVDTYSATDPEGGAVTWLLSGTDRGDFEISTSGVLSFRTPPDRERPVDANRDSIYLVTVLASDGVKIGELDVTVTVTNVDEAPVISSGPATVDYAENKTSAVATYRAADPEGGAISWSLSGNDAADFDISAGGVLRFRDAPDYEVATDAGGDNTYDVTVEASDGAYAGTRDVAITVTNVNEPPVIDSGPATVNYDENDTAAVATYSATDPEGVAVSWSLSGTDRGDFEISGGGVLSFRTPPDRENPADANRDSIYLVTVRASDGANAGTRDVTVSVVDVAETPVVSGLTSVDYDENDTAAVATYRAIDPQNDAITWSLSGTDRGDFAISAGGVLSFHTPPDREKPVDANRDSIYLVTLFASDGTNTGTLAVTVTVRDVNEMPVVRGPATVNYTEDGTAAVATYRASDPEGDAIDWTLSGTDSDDFAISAVGVLSFGTPPDRENPADADGDSVYKVTVDAFDGANTATLDVVVTVVARRSGGGGGGGGGASGGGGGGGGPPAVPIPSDEDFDWNVSRDIESLDRDNGRPTDIWSDGATIWVLENSASGADAVFAYGLASGERLAAQEFELDRRNRFSHGIWSDGETIWIADSGQDQLFAYILATGERLEERDVELADRNRDPRGIWSNGETLYVLDSGKDGLFVYQLSTGELLAEYPLDKLNKNPRGIWSDGATIWVSDDGAERIFAYRVESRALVRYEAEEFTFRSLIKASNGDARGIWSEGDVLYVADEQEDKLYTYNMPDAIDARLASLSLSDVETDEFSPGRHSYTSLADYGVSITTVEPIAAQPGATIVIAPTDADGDTENGHQVALGAETEITITVTSSDGSRTKSYRVLVEAPACLTGLTAERLSMVTFVGGNVAELSRCARELGVGAFFFFSTAESWLLYAPDAPAFLSRQFNQHFGNGVPPGTPLIALSTAEKRTENQESSE